MVGEGGFSKVVRAVHKRTGIRRAVKKIDKVHTQPWQFEDEIRALIILDHPHIVKIIEYFEDEDYFYVVSELCTGPDLYDYIAEAYDLSGEGQMPERDASVLIRQCLKAVICCHAHGFIHQDLKPENFVMASRDPELRDIRLIDFGFAYRIQPGQGGTDVVGTAGYMAPETLLPPDKHDKAVDIWSLGVVLFMCLTGEMFVPDDKDEALHIAMDPGYVERRLNCKALTGASPEVRDLLQRMLRYSPADRISGPEALAHPFIQAHSRGWLGGESPGEAGYIPSQIDAELIKKMQRFAAAPAFKKLAVLSLVHLAAVSSMPPPFRRRLLSARHTFRTLDLDGDGIVTLEDMTRGLERQGVKVPSDFAQLFSELGSTERGKVHYTELVSCILFDDSFPENLVAEGFRRFDKQSNGVIDAVDLQLLKNSYAKRQSHDDMIREVDPLGKGYITYEDFIQIMSTDPRCPLCQNKNMYCN